MSLHQDRDALSQKADIFGQPPHALFAENAATLAQPSVDAIVNDMALKVAAGNATHLGTGMYAWARTDEDGYLTPEQREKKEREKAQTQAVVNNVSTQIISMQTYNDVLTHYRSERVKTQSEIDAIDQRVEERQEKRQELQQKMEDCQKDVEISGQELVIAIEENDDANVKLEFYKEQLERYQRIAKEGGAIDDQDREYSSRINAEGEQEFFYVDEENVEHIAPPGTVIHGEELMDVIKRQLETVNEASVASDDAKNNLENAQGVYEAFVADYRKFRNYAQEEIDFLNSQDKIDLERRDELEGYLKELDKGIEFLESDEIAEKAKNGELTADEMRAGLGDLAWNVMVDRHGEYNLTKVALSDDQQGYYDVIEKRRHEAMLERQQDQYLATGSTIENLKSGALSLADTVAQVGADTWNWFVNENPDHGFEMAAMNDIEQQKFEQRIAFQNFRDSRNTQPIPGVAPVSVASVDPSAAQTTEGTAATLASADGLGVKADGVDLKNSFNESTTTTTPAATPEPMAPTITTAAIQHVRTHGMGMGMNT